MSELPAIFRGLLFAKISSKLGTHWPVGRPVEKWLVPITVEIRALYYCLVACARDRCACRLHPGQFGGSQARRRIDRTGLQTFFCAGDD